MTLKSERNLGSSKMLNERVFDSVGDAILIINPNNYRIISANEAASKELKIRKADLVGKACYEVTHHRSSPCEPPHDTCPLREMLITGKPAMVEHQHFDQDNRRIDVEVSVHPIKESSGKIIQAVHIDRDITRRKDFEREEKAKSDEIRGIIDGIGDLLFVMDKNRIITEVNKSFCEAFKKKPEELLGKRCYEIVHGTDCVWPNCPAEKTMKTKQIVTEEIIDPNIGIPLLITTPQF
jgi:PAS domain S-box-containing protein